MHLFLVFACDQCCLVVIDLKVKCNLEFPTTVTPLETEGTKLRHSPEVRETGKTNS
jgi:hypothetical protein